MTAFLSHTLPRLNPTVARDATANASTATPQPAASGPETLDPGSFLGVALLLLLRGVLGAVAEDDRVWGRTLLQSLVRVADVGLGANLRAKAAAAIWEVSR
jgi:hypothetical protein